MRTIASIVKVTVAPEASKQLAKLPNVIRRRMFKLMDRLESYPDVSGVKWLTDNLAGKARLRTGDYRLQFHVETSTIVDEETEEETTLTEVVVEKVGHRDGFYGE